MANDTGTYVCLYTQICPCFAGVSSHAHPTPCRAGCPEGLGRGGVEEGGDVLHAATDTGPLCGECTAVGQSHVPYRAR